MDICNLVKVDVDKIFEQLTVKQIDTFLKKLQNDAERKREELRMMVGEKYRDLLKAADTISHMKETSSDVQKHIEEIIKCCSQLKDHQLLGFQMDQPPMDKSLKNFYGIAVQIKLLIEIPELIWARLDQEDYFVATQLFVFSRHISIGLNLDINKPIMRYFPVADKLWSILNTFFHTIKVSCLHVLEREQLSSETAANCLASIHLLDNSTCDQLFSILIKLRIKTLKYAITDDDSQLNVRVRDRILSSVQIMINTLELICKCFIAMDNNRQGLLIECLNLMKLPETQPTLALINTEHPRMIALLPDIIANFRPCVDVTPLSKEMVHKLMESWLQHTQQEVGIQMKALIDSIATVKIVHHIKTEAANIEKPTNWKIILEELALPANLDLYKFYYEPLMNGRIQEIITDSLENAINGTCDDIKKLAKKTTNIKVVPFIWTEDNIDIPLSLKEALSQNKQQHKLLLKTKGYTPTILKICQSLDDKLKMLFDDVKLYAGDTGPDRQDLKSIHNNRNIDANVDANIDAVVVFLRTSSKASVQKLIPMIQSIEYKQNHFTLIFFATILQALAELCPHLKFCLSKDIYSRGWEETKRSTVNNLEQWANLCRQLSDESLKFWKLWIDLFINDLLLFDDSINDGNENNRQRVCFIGSRNLVAATREFTNWEKIPIEEKDEQDNPIESIIFIPSQPSVSLQVFLYRVCCQLNHFVPHVLPKIVITILAERIVQSLHKTYSVLCEHPFVKSNQNTSLQYFFDIKFLNVIFGRPDNNKKMMENLQQLSGCFKNNIDPFDFELFHKYIMINVKKSVAQMQHKLGSLIGNFEHLTTAIGGTQHHLSSTTSIGEKDPNVLPLSKVDTTTGWFPLLPVTLLPIPLNTPTNNSKKKEFNQPQSSQPTTMAQTTFPTMTQPITSANLANVRSGAAAFFGGLSQDWFR